MQSSSLHCNFRVDEDDDLREGTKVYTAYLIMDEDSTARRIRSPTCHHQTGCRPKVVRTKNLGWLATVRLNFALQF